MIYFVGCGVNDLFVLIWKDVLGVVLCSVCWMWWVFYLIYIDDLCRFDKCSVLGNVVFVISYYVVRFFVMNF